jgi:hypothetical protein
MKASLSLFIEWRVEPEQSSLFPGEKKLELRSFSRVVSELLLHPNRIENIPGSSLFFDAQEFGPKEGKELPHL